MGDPFIFTSIEDFIVDLDGMILKYRNEMVMKSQPFDTDFIPYVIFFEHFKKKSDWAKLLEQPDSNLIKVLMLEDLFLKRKIISIT